MSIIDTAKAHPAAAIGVLAVGLVILYMLMSSGGASAAQVQTGGTVDTGLQASELQAATGLATAQLAAQSQDKQTDAALKIANLTAQSGLLGKYDDNQTAFDISQLQAGVAKTNIAAQQTLGSQQIASQTALGTAQINAQSADTIAQLKQVSDIAGITSAVNIAGIQANAATTMHSIDAVTNAANIASTNQANAAASAQKGATARSAISGIGGLLSSVFSFL